MTYIWIYNIIFSLYLLNTCPAEEIDAPNKPTLIRLADHLMAGYNKGVRPVKDWRRATTVNIDLVIYSILGVDEKNQILTTYIWYNQSWVDEFLTWDPSKFDNVTKISLPSNMLWEPDIMVIEFVDHGKSTDSVNFVYIHYNGKVFYNKPVQIMSTCSLDIYYFPFDRQNCCMSFTSWTHTTQDINISFSGEEDKLNTSPNVYVNDGEWELQAIIPNYRVFNDYGHTFGELKFFIIMQRKPMFYVVNLLLPSMLLMLMDIAGFYLPPESGERVSFKITLLLGYSVSLIIVYDKLPAAGAPLIGLYFVMCMVMLVINLMESIFIVRIVHKQNLHPEVPKWVKTLVLEKMAALLGCTPRCQSATSCYDMSDQMESSSTVTSFNNDILKENNRQSLGTRDSEVLACILKEVTSIREFMKIHDDLRITKEWLEVGYIMDQFLFRAYLIALLLFAVSFTIIWI